MPAFMSLLERQRISVRDAFADQLDHTVLCQSTPWQKWALSAVETLFFHMFLGGGYDVFLVPGGSVKVWATVLC